MMEAKQKCNYYDEDQNDKTDPGKYTRP